VSEPTYDLGIDVAKRTFDVELLGTHKPHRAQFRNSAQGFAELLQWLGRWKIAHVHACMEATGIYGRALARALYDAGHTVSIVNPAAISAAAKAEMVRAKTDRVDAGVIARFCQKHHPKAWEPPPAEIEQLQALVARLDDLITMRVAEENRLGSSTELTQSSIETVIATLTEQIAEIEQQIRDHIDRHPGLRQDAKLLESIPGIGEKTAALLISLGIHRFDSARQLTAFLGLTPRPYESGTSIRKKARITKMGSTSARSKLYWPSVTAVKCSSVFAAFAQRLRQRGKPKMVVLVAVMRKLLAVAYGVVRSGLPYDPDRASAH